MWTWFKKKLSGDYMRRQIYMMSSLGLFYIIIIALFAIPLLGAFVVVLIQGVMDFRFLILGGGIILLGLAVFYLGRFTVRFFQKVRRDGFMALRDARNRSRQGQPVEIGLFGGLLTFSYSGRSAHSALDQAEEPPRLITDAAGELPPKNDPVRQLRELSVLRNEGVIDADEFQRLKSALIRHFCESEPEEDPAAVSEE